MSIVLNVEEGGGGYASYIVHLNYVAAWLPNLLVCIYSSTDVIN